MQSFRSLTRVDSLDLPDGARVYKVPKSVSAIGIVGLIVFGIFCIPTLLFPALEPNKNTWPLVIARVQICWISSIFAFGSCAFASAS